MFHARDGAIFSKNSTFVFFDGASPITENGIQLRSPSPIMAPARIEKDFVNCQNNLCFELFGIALNCLVSKIANKKIVQSTKS